MLPVSPTPLSVPFPLPFFALEPDPRLLTLYAPLGATSKAADLLSSVASAHPSLTSAAAGVLSSGKAAVESVASAAASKASSAATGDGKSSAGFARVEGAWGVGVFGGVLLEVLGLVF